VRGPAGLPLTWRLALGFISRKLAALDAVEVSPMLQRVIVAVTYGIGAASPVLAAAFSDSVVTGQEWSGIGMAFFIAFWGTFKSNTTVIAPNRTEWTPAQRAVDVAMIAAAVVVQDAKVIAADKVADAKVEAEKILTR
jgi:VIT1/CCC1 family predicted Fe2+/Mn2+ transporter